MLGFLIVSILMIILAFSMLGSIANAFKTSEPVMPRNAVLTIDMSKFNLTEQSDEGDFNVRAMVGGGEQRENLGLWTAIQAINAAANDPSIKFVYLKTDDALAGTASLEEFRNALKQLRNSGKAIIALTETPSNGSYYLATVADKIFLSNYKGGMNTLVGLTSQIMYMKDILDKLGVNIQLIRHGKFKSAGEPYIRNSISDENREQYETLLGSVWSGFVNEIAEARDMTPEEFNALIDGLKLNSPEDFLKYGLVDELLDDTEREKRLCDLYGVDDIKDFKQISLSDYAKLKVKQNYKAKDKIAIIYADGDINDGWDMEEVSGDRFAHILATVRKDSTIKAVVFRVNSPGGSVVAADKIKVAADYLKETKPVIASYGNYAASGGYWISSNCDKIFCDASTLTGSIGVFSIIPDFSGTANKVGINVEAVSSNKHGDMLSGMRALDEAELAYMQESVEDIYDEFTTIVSMGRGLDKSFVDDVAQGRVWAGTDALGIGLVDEIGGIQEAIKYAIYMTGSDNQDISNWNICEFPLPASTIAKIMARFGLNSSAKLHFAGTPIEPVERLFRNWDESRTGEVYALMPDVLEIK